MIAVELAHNGGFCQKNAAFQRYFALAGKIGAFDLDKTVKLGIIELDGLASSLFRPRRFASPRAAGFLFSCRTPLRSFATIVLFRRLPPSHL